ncbi:MAG: hypothetical protein K2J34_11365 [Muribaculaceae bacterium]|nr:hypothetical protein [Muribaculaceae bacterium]
MNPKSFLFIKSWMQPLKALPLQQRWNVMEAIVEYSTSGCIPDSLDTMETLAFGFIRNEIDRMRHHRNETYAKRRAVANVHREKGQQTAMQTDSVNSNDDSDAKACNALHDDAPYDIISESKSESGSESEKKSSSTSSGVRVRGNAGNHSPHDDSQPQTNISGDDARRWYDFRSRTTRNVWHYSHLRILYGGRSG